MLKYVETQLVTSYLVFSLFHFYQMRHKASFQGASAAFEGTLMVFVALSTLAWVVFMVMLGVRTTWYFPIVFSVCCFPVSLIVDAILVPRGKGVEVAISLLGFVGVPVALFFMFGAIPK